MIKNLIVLVAIVVFAGCSNKSLKKSEHSSLDWVSYNVNTFAPRPVVYDETPSSEEIIGATALNVISIVSSLGFIFLFEDYEEEKSEILSDSLRKADFGTQKRLINAFHKNLANTPGWTNKSSLDKYNDQGAADAYFEFELIKWGLKSELMEDHYFPLFTISARLNSLQGTTLWQFEGNLEIAETRIEDIDEFISSPDRVEATFDQAFDKLSKRLISNLAALD